MEENFTILNNNYFYYQYGKNSTKSLKLILNTDMKKKELFVEIIIMYSIDILLILYYNTEQIKKYMNKILTINEFIYIQPYNITYTQSKKYNQSINLKPNALILNKMTPNIPTYLDLVLYEDYNIPITALIFEIDMANVLYLNTLNKIEIFYNKYKINTNKNLIDWNQVKLDGYDGIYCFPYISTCDMLWYKSLEFDSLYIWNLNCIISNDELIIDDVYDNVFPGLLSGDV